MDNEYEGEVVRWYTRARKFPQVVGRTVEGNKIPGGPYTITQAVGGFSVLMVLFLTAGFWGRWVGGFIPALLVIVSATAAATFVLGRIPPGMRNPVAAMVSAAKVLLKRSPTRVGGRSLNLRSPHIVLVEMKGVDGSFSQLPRPTYGAQPTVVAASVVPTTQPAYAQVEVAPSVSQRSQPPAESPLATGLERALGKALERERNHA